MALDAQWSAVARGYRFALILAGVVGAAAVAGSAAAGHWLAGIFICVGLGLGGWNSRRLWTDTQRLTDGSAQAGEKWRGPAVGATARRLGLITLLGFLIALAYRPLGWTVFLGLLVFQIVMIAMVAPPLRRVIAPQVRS
ncbi:MAG TPA: hypothetical protein VFT62_09910 [Mycobacteriales bacterium]|nr:hypothetical protein [Mycobacteriales bacterium]